MTKTFPTLYRQTKNGKIQQWKIWTEGPEIHTEYGLIDGKKQSSYKLAKAKYVGQNNERTPERQAEKEAHSIWMQKLDRKYSMTIEAAKEPDYFPMLAKPLDESKLIFPCDVQRKFDGVRCLAFWNGDHSEIKLMSRGGKFYDTCMHLKEQIAYLLPKGSGILDGEIYLHGKTFQSVTRLVKKYRKGKTEKLNFHIYDFPVKGTKSSWDSRKSQLSKLFENAENKPISNLIEAETITVNTLDEIWKKHQQFVDEGYEGAMVRLHNGEYIFNHRSNSLFKVKSFQDDEFKIVDYLEGEGRLRDCVIWKCETEDQKTFEVSQTGPLEERKKLFKEADKYIGKMLKVKYFGHTESGLPRFPIGLGIRLEEDM